MLLVLLSLEYGVGVKKWNEGCIANLWGQKLNGLYSKDMQCYPEGLQESLKEFEIGGEHGQICALERTLSSVLS